MRKEGVEGDIIGFTGSDGTIIEGWLVYLFSGKIQSDVYGVAIVVGTSLINCGISSSSLYYVCWKGFPRTCIEFVQLLGILKRDSNILIQDTINIARSLRYYQYIYCHTQRGEW